MIIETCLLNDKEKISACILAKENGADFVKTSTGFSSGGANVDDIKLMRRTVGDKHGSKGKWRDKDIRACTCYGQCRSR
ncbi:hypothetical protein Ct9H90mP29_09300 [bacterium]|nr:MAG: hypothetical protein Ct9H90mP29_09300 [bacterium]